MSEQNTNNTNSGVRKTASNSSNLIQSTEENLHVSDNNPLVNGFAHEESTFEPQNLNINTDNNTQQDCINGFATAPETINGETSPSDENLETEDLYHPLFVDMPENLAPRDEVKKVGAEETPSDSDEGNFEMEAREMIDDTSESASISSNTHCVSSSNNQPDNVDFIEEDFGTFDRKTTEWSEASSPLNEPVSIPYLEVTFESQDDNRLSLANSELTLCSPLMTSNTSSSSQSTPNNASSTSESLLPKPSCSSCTCSHCLMPIRHVPLMQSTGTQTAPLESLPSTSQNQSLRHEPDTGAPYPGADEIEGPPPPFGAIAPPQAPNDLDIPVRGGNPPEENLNQLDFETWKSLTRSIIKAQQFHSENASQRFYLPEHLLLHEVPLEEENENANNQDETDDVLVLGYNEIDSIESDLEVTSSLSNAIHQALLGICVRDFSLAHINSICEALAQSFASTASMTAYFEQQLLSSVDLSTLIKRITKSQISTRNFNGNEVGNPVNFVRQALQQGTSVILTINSFDLYQTPTANGWTYRVVLGIDSENNFILSNPRETFSEAAVIRALNADNSSFIPAREVSSRFNVNNSEDLLSLMPLSSDGENTSALDRMRSSQDWLDMNVFGEVVNILREVSASYQYPFFVGSSYFTPAVSHLAIPSNERPRVTVLLPQDYEKFLEIAQNENEPSTNFFYRYRPVNLSQRMNLSRSLTSDLSKQSSDPMRSSITSDISESEHTDRAEWYKKCQLLRQTPTNSISSSENHNLENSIDEQVLSLSSLQLSRTRNDNNSVENCVPSSRSFDRLVQSTGQGALASIWSHSRRSWTGDRSVSSNCIYNDHNYQNSNSDGMNDYVQTGNLPQQSQSSYQISSSIRRENDFDISLPRRSASDRHRNRRKDINK